MSDGIYVALSGAVGRLRNLETSANNLSNLETSGYKRVSPSFREFLGQNRLPESGQAPDAVPIGGSGPIDRSSVTIAGSRESTRQGDLQPSGGSLDVGIDGPGFFSLKGQNGVRYSRDGRLRRSPDGFLVGAEGLPVLGDSGPIRIPNEDVVITPDGQIKRGEQSLGRIRLVDFAQGTPFAREGASLLRAGGPEIQATGRLVQGSLESSNVRPLHELVGLIDIQRSFEALQQTILAYREMDSRAIEVGKSAS